MNKNAPLCHIHSIITGTQSSATAANTTPPIVGVPSFVFSCHAGP